MLDTQKICRQLEYYTKEYYSELWRQIDRYASIQYVFPSFLKGSKRIVAMLCTDGILLSHWSSKEDSFTCEVRQKSISDTIFEISNGKFTVEYPLGNTFDFQVAKAKLYKGADSTGTPIWQSPWDRIEASSKFGSLRWGGTYARMLAVNDVLTFVAAHMMQIRDDKAPIVLNKLEGIIEKFEDLLDKAKYEEDLQKFLSTHPVILSPTALKVLPKHKLGSEYIPDFVICEIEHEYIFVEIEAPSKKLFNKNGNPSTFLTHAQQQVEDWREWVQENIAYARNNLPGITDPNCWVIIGRDTALLPRDRKALYRKNKELSHITILTFDDLLKKARSHLNNLERLCLIK